jgi:hypothetical protein
VLQRNQKTRGRFYLYLLYEVNHGRVHWAFFPGKGPRMCAVSCGKSAIGIPIGRCGSPWIAIPRTRSGPG